MRGKGKEKHSGDDWSIIDECIVAHCKMNGIRDEVIARITERTVAEVRKCWWRILWNGSVKKFEKEHHIVPIRKLKNRDKIDNLHMKEFIRIQYTTPEIKASIGSISKKIGKTPAAIRCYLLNRENKLFVKPNRCVKKRKAK